MQPLVELVLADFAAERIAVDAEKARGPRLVAVGAIQHALNEFLFEFVDGLIKEDSPIYHLPDQRFQLIFHDRTLRTKKVCGRTYRPGYLAQFPAR